MKGYGLMNNSILSMYRNLGFEEAVSHKIHSRMFEILGYLSIIDKTSLSKEDQDYLKRVENISKSLISELHSIIDHYGNKSN